MENKREHKFQNRMDLTYEQYVHASFDGIIQLAKELQQVLGKEESFRIISKAREKFDLELINKQLSGRKAIENFEDFKELMKELHENKFASHLFTVTCFEEASEIEFHTTECLFAKVFRDMNAADLGYAMMCQPDFVTTPHYYSHVQLKRTKTLMQGDDYCDTCYCYSEQSSR